jgi:lysozyme
MARAKGLDISKWNGQMDFGAVRDAGYTFVFIRATYNVTVDPLFLSNWERAGQAGLLRGAYHFMTVADPAPQAQAFRNAIGSAGDLAELPPVLDVEAEGLVPAKVSQFIDAFEQLTDTRLIIYSSPGYWNSGMTGVDVSGHDLWVANWGVSEPKLPAGWSSWRFWQYTNQGQVTGHTGALDLNVFNGTEEELRAYAGGGGEMSLEDRVTALENRAAALERLVAAQESLVAALEGRVTALESGSGQPAPVEEPEVPEVPDTSIPSAGAMLKVVAEWGLNFRTEPKVDSGNVIRKLSNGEIVEKLGNMYGDAVGGNTLWYLVREQVEGKRGYAHSSYFQQVG